METTSSVPLPLSADQFQRVFQTIYSVLDGHAKPEVSCIFFATCGALILSEHFDIECRPYAGAELLNIGDADNTVITFGEFRDGRLESSTSAFHCWIETKHYAIDFMSPIYHENLVRRGYAGTIPRRMFVRALSGMVDSLDQVETQFSYALQPDEQLTGQLLQEFLDNDLATDLLAACKKWFRPHPQDMPPKNIASDSGRLYQFALHGPTIDGRW